MINIDSANGINFIETLIGWNEGVTVYEMKVEDEPVFEITGNFERVYENCCGYTRVHDLSIENANYEYDTTTYSYKVFVAYNE